MSNSVFKCLRCRECCFFSSIDDCPVVYPWEKRVLEKLALTHAGGAKLSFKPYLSFSSKDKLVVVLYKWIIEGYCPFYDKDNRACRIYEDRPFSCKMYPLILGLKDNTLRLSTTCKWVQENMKEPVQPIDPSKVFPYEYDVAVKNFVRLKYIIQIMSSMGLNEVIGEETGDKQVIDVDEYITIEVND